MTMSRPRIWRQQQARENAAMTRKLRAQLPQNRDLLRKIQEYGLQPI